MADVFGIPGDFVLQFYGMLTNSPIRVIGSTREDCAGYAADAYARIRGRGAVCVTDCVGGLSLCNSIAGAFAEKFPVVLISGSPGIDERRNDPLSHHKVRIFETQKEVFEKITIASAVFDDPLTFAGRRLGLRCPHRRRALSGDAGCPSSYRCQQHLERPSRPLRHQPGAKPIGGSSYKTPVAMPPNSRSRLLTIDRTGRLF